MPLTNAQKQKDLRARRKAKLERLAVLEGALVSLISDCDLAYDALGNSPPQFDSVRRSFQIIADRARKALGDVR